MVAGHVPWNLSLATRTLSPAPPGAAVVAGAGAAVGEVRRVELPRTVTVAVTVDAAAAVQEEPAAAVVVNGSVQAGPVMENLDVCA